MDLMIDRIGGEPKVHELVEHFYDLIENLPRGRAIMEMHMKGHGLSHVRKAQFEFLCGFFGRHHYEHQRHGQMSLREMHAHVEIRREDAENWLAIMEQAMAETNIAEPMKQQLSNSFRRAALTLVNIDT